MQVAIDEDRSCATRSLQPGIDGGALPGIFCEPKYLDVRRILDSLDRAIDRSIIDKNDFMIKVTQRRAQLGLQDRHVCFFVEERHNHRDLWRVCHRRHSGSVR